MSEYPGGFSSRQNSPQFANLQLDGTIAAKALGEFTASGMVINGAGYLAGFSLMATTATVAQIRLRDGQDATGLAIKRVDVSAGFGIIATSSFPGIRFDAGLYLEVVAGAPAVCIWVVPDQAVYE